MTAQFEVRPERAEQCREDAELRRGAQEERSRVREQWAEIGQSADAHKDDQRECAGLDAHNVERGATGRRRWRSRRPECCSGQAAETDRHQEQRLELFGRFRGTATTG